VPLTTWKAPAVVVQVGALAGQPGEQPHLVVVGDRQPVVPAIDGVEPGRDRPPVRVGGVSGGDGEMIWANADGGHGKLLRLHI
jgi:hypothetical protein